MRSNVVSALLVTVTGLTVIVAGGHAYGLPDCDGSTPKQSNCGTATACQNPQQNPQHAWYCPNQAIETQFIQHECNSGSGSGSTLCGSTSTSLVCTKRFTCELAELRDPDTGLITSRSCAQALAGGVNNSSANKTDYVQCRDTSGG